MPKAGDKSYSQNKEKKTVKGRTRILATAAKREKKEN